MKTNTRIIADQIKNLTGMSLVSINKDAIEFVNAGLVKNRKEALNYILLQNSKPVF